MEILYKPEEKELFDYLNFFGLKEVPFSLTPDPEYFFPASSHIKVMEVFKYGFIRKESFMILTGAPGLGKTLLLNLILKNLPEDYVKIFLLTPTLSPYELIISISQKLNIISLENNTPSKEALLNLLQSYLENLKKEKKTLLIVIDEAQNLPVETLEELRLLSNFETEKEKLIQFFLAGQPLLKEKLKSPELHQLAQRISIWEDLTPFDKDEIGEYVKFRLAKAGHPIITFERGFENLLYKYTQGIPRLINKLMDRTLLIAYSEKSKKIYKKFIKLAKKSFPDGVFPVKSRFNFLKIFKG
jgi:general secretion pathway protein A